MEMCIKFPTCRSTQMMLMAYMQRCLGVNILDKDQKGVLKMNYNNNLNNNKR